MSAPETTTSYLLVFTAEEVAAAFNEWMRRYTETPEAFEREWQMVGEFLQQKAAGQEPDYGVCSTAYLLSLIADAAPS